MASIPPTVCVIIAAKNAAGDDRARRSLGLARESRRRGGRRRRRVERRDRGGSLGGGRRQRTPAHSEAGRTNRGPAFARNHAIAHSHRPVDRHTRRRRFFSSRPFRQPARRRRLGFRGRQHRFHRCAQRSAASLHVPRFAADPRFLDLCRLHRRQYFKARRLARRDRLSQAGDAARFPRSASR